MEWLEVVDSANGRRVSDPLKRLPIGDNPDVVHTIDEVKEHDESVLVVGLGEPGSMIEETERRPEKKSLFKARA